MADDCSWGGEWFSFNRVVKGGFSEVLIFELRNGDEIEAIIQNSGAQEFQNEGSANTKTLKWKEN